MLAKQTLHAVLARDVGLVRQAISARLGRELADTGQSLPIRRCYVDRRPRARLALLVDTDRIAVRLSGHMGSWRASRHVPIAVLSVLAGLMSLSGAASASGGGTRI